MKLQFKALLPIALAAATFNVNAAAEKHLVIIGDTNMAMSFNPTTGVNYNTTTAAKLLPYFSVTNISGLGRTTVNAWDLRTDTSAAYAISAFQNNAVVIQTGFDDWGQGIPVSKFKDSYLKLLYATAVNTQAKRYCALPHRTRVDSLPDRNKVGATLEQYRAAIRSLASAGWCKLIPSDNWFSFSDVYNVNMMKDGVNLTPQSHSRYASKLRQAIGF